MNYPFDGPASKWTFTKSILMSKSWVCRKCSFHISHDFCGTCPHKKMIFNEMLLLKGDKIICSKANYYFRRLSGPFCKNKEISKVLYVLSFGLKLEMKLVKTVFISIGVKFRQTSYAWKEILESKNFLFCCWLGIVSSFFLCVEEMFRFSFPSFA